MQDNINSSNQHTLFTQNTVLPYVATWLKSDHTKFLVWGERHSHRLVTWLRNPTSKVPGSGYRDMVQKFQGTKNHWRITHGREGWQCAQSSYLRQVKNNIQKWLMNLKNGLWHRCTMPFCTTLFTKPHRISVKHDASSARTRFRLLMMNQISWTGLPKAWNMVLQ